MRQQRAPRSAPERPRDKAPLEAAPRAVPRPQPWQLPSGSPAIDGAPTSFRAPPRADPLRAAGAGIASPSTALPHAAAIQRSFGHHDVGSIEAHLGDVATRAAGELGASAFTHGHHVVFAGAPDLHTAAHEAAHVIQQTGGDRAAPAIQRKKGLLAGTRVLCPLLHPGHTFEVVKETATGYVLRDTVSHETLGAIAEWQVVPEASEASSSSSSSSTTAHAPEHVLMTDELLAHRGMGGEAVKHKTPKVVIASVRGAAGKRTLKGSYESETYKETARIDVRSVSSDSGVSITYTLKCNPHYMCARQYPDPSISDVRDLIPIYLERENDSYADLIEVAEPSADKNVYKGGVTYTWDCLARLLGVAGDKKQSAEEAVKSKYKVLGVKAQWLANTKDGTNAQNHTMGGVIQKGGSGLVPLDKITLHDLRATEASQRNTEWNRGEQLTETRAAFQRHADIAQLGKELASTLEAESEYLVDQAGYLLVVDKMQALLAHSALWPHFGIVKMTGGSKKTYTDTYYDIVGAPVPAHDLSLLQKSVVLRERHVDSDPEDTFLLAVKGASHPERDHSGETGERLRLAAQTNLARSRVLEGEGKGTALSEQGQVGVDRFVADTDVDNPFGRTVEHALSGRQEAGGTTIKDRLGATGHIRPVLQIRSQRYKFLMELEGMTAIDFSADRAVGVAVDPKTSQPMGPTEEPKAPVIFSFEFGVGHPGLAASATAGGTGATKGVSEMAAQFGKQVGAKAAPQVARPYHVPKDLTNPAVFAKSDYQQFKALRDQVLDQALGMKKQDLGTGGNKAHLLAKKLGLIAS